MSKELSVGGVISGSKSSGRLVGSSGPEETFSTLFPVMSFTNSDVNRTLHWLILKHTLGMAVFFIPLRSLVVILILKIVPSSDITVPLVRVYLGSSIKANVSKLSSPNSTESIEIVSSNSNSNIPLSKSNDTNLCSTGEV